MPKIRHLFIVLGMLLSLTAASSEAQVSIRFWTPNLSIGINLPVYPDLVPIPGYPVYYAPYLQVNYFFYDGLYWVFKDGNWYTSSWYDGPWAYVEPLSVPVFILRIPVRYYRHPPPFFHSWRLDAPPRWGEHWGYGWEQHRRGWDQWDRRAAPAPAPLPEYQRQYPRDRYPRQLMQQRQLEQRYYRFQPREPAVRRYFQDGSRQGVPTQPGVRQAPQQGYPPQRNMQGPQPQQSYPPQRNMQRPQPQQQGPQRIQPRPQGGQDNRYPPSYRREQQRPTPQRGKGGQQNGEIWYEQGQP